jgi:hypothetical protein
LGFFCHFWIVVLISSNISRLRAVLERSQLAERPQAAPKLLEMAAAAT